MPTLIGTIEDALRMGALTLVGIVLFLLLLYGAAKVVTVGVLRGRDFWERDRRRRDSRWKLNGKRGGREKTK